MPSTHAIRRFRALGRALLLAAALVRPAPGQVALPTTMHRSPDGLQLLQGDLPSTGLYDEGVLHAVALTFAQPDWWAQLVARYQSETDLLADLVVDGVLYPGVGVRFKGTTSYRTTGDSPKKPFNIDVSFTDPEQRVLGYRTLNLNGCGSFTWGAGGCESG